MFFEIGVVKNFAKKSTLESFFNKVAYLNFIKKKL